MVHAKLPVLSLLCLLCALLMLPPELTLGMVPPHDPREEEAVEFAIEQHNQDDQKSSRYFKKVRLMEARKEMVNGVEYHLTMKMVRTGCRKRTGETKTYEEIQQCQELLGNKKKKICYFKVSSPPSSNEMKLEVTDCEIKRKDILCPGK